MNKVSDEILKLLKSEAKAFSAMEICKSLNFNTKEDLKALLMVLKNLEQELKVYVTKNGNYMLFENSNCIVGQIQVTTKGHGFVRIDDLNEIKIPANKIRDAVNKDKVLVNIINNKSNPKEGEVVRVVERNKENIVGLVKIIKNKIIVIPDDNKLNFEVEIPNNTYPNLVEGHKVVIELLTPIKNTRLGKIVKVIGHINDPGIDILSIMAKYDINDTFPDEVLNSLVNVPSEVSDSDIVGRTDLRDKMIFTIDGDDTKDIDDAISVEKIDDNHYLLGVHIADVSHYVKEFSKLDIEATNRATSVYLADRVVPMLPHELSNGICSLNPNVDRLAMTCMMKIDKQGRIVHSDIFESVIKSRIQMTYKNVNKILEENIIPDGYSDYVDTLRLMNEVSNCLRRKMDNRGYIDFEIDEGKIIVNETGEAIDVVMRERGTGEKLIENFMIAANEAVAETFKFISMPLIYRVHGEPSEEKMEVFFRLLHVLNYKVETNLKKLTPKTIQQVLNELKEKPEFYVLSNQLLRSMQKAIYSENNIGHYGLASKTYCHFTSPIRRYPDLTVHRSIKKCLLNKNIDLETVNAWEKRLPELAEISSVKERMAVDCEREVEKMKKAEYMEKHIGEEHEGMITGVTSFGFFVQLKNSVEGLVRVEDMHDDFYRYDESTFALVGEKSKKRYCLGDIVTIKVIAASKLTQNVDFEIVLKEE